MVTDEPTTGKEKITKITSELVSDGIVSAYKDSKTGLIYINPIKNGKSYIRYVINENTFQYYPNTPGDATESSTLNLEYVTNDDIVAKGTIQINTSDINHEYDENGFCVDCGIYQPATLNRNGVYEIGNAGQLFWFASLVNGDRTHADFDSQNNLANAVLVNDIDLENREWKPVISFNGTIDHCISGINPATGTIHFGNTTINMAALNSNIKGEISGGIVGENNGLITGCRNASVAAGTQCGGIAGLNTGKIYCCANNSAVGTSASKVSGGLAGKNGGIIESSYNSAVINGSSEGAKGSIAGINGYEGSGNPKVTNVFYRTANGLNAVGTDSSVIPDSTNIGMSSISDFQNDSFTDKLNSVSDDTVTWVRHSVLNKSYPTIEGNFLKINVKSAGNNIFVKGSMHSSLNISYTVCDKNDSLYKLLSAGTGENKILKSYSLSLTDNDGNYIPAELWCQGSFEISVPVDSENVKFAGIDEEGNIVYCKPDSVENGIAVFTVSHPMSFAIVETAKNVPNGGDTGITTPTTNSDDSTPVQTGSATGRSVLLIAMFSLVLIIALRRRNNIE